MDNMVDVKKEVESSEDEQRESDLLSRAQTFWIGAALRTGLGLGLGLGLNKTSNSESEIESSSVLPHIKSEVVEGEDNRDVDLREDSTLLRILNADGEEFPQLQQNNGIYYMLPHGVKYQVQLTNPFPGVYCSANLTIDGHDMGDWILDPGEVCPIERPVSANKKFTFLRTEMVSTAEKAAAKLLQNSAIDLTEEEKVALSHTPLDSGIISGKESNGLITVIYCPPGEKRKANKPAGNKRKREVIEKIEPTIKKDCNKINNTNNSKAKINPRPRSCAHLSHRRAANQGRGGSRRARPSTGKRSSRLILASSVASRETAGATTLQGESSQEFENCDDFESDSTRALTVYVRLVASVTEDFMCDDSKPTHLSSVGKKKLKNM